MDSNNWRPAQAEQPPPTDGGDWRTQLQPDSRQKIVNKIMETLKRHLPVSGQEGLKELTQVAITFEEKIYSAAQSQSDYLHKISLRMLTMESKSQTPNAMPSNSTGGSRNPQDPASLDSTAQTGGTNTGDWQEETYQKVKAMKDLYYADLNEMYSKISTKLQQHDNLPQPPKSEQLGKVRLFKHMLERLMLFLQTPKTCISPSHRDKLLSCEKHILSLLNSHRLRKPVPSMPPGQTLSPQLQTTQQSQHSHSQLPKS